MSAPALVFMPGPELANLRECAGTIKSQACRIGSALNNGAITQHSLDATPAMLLEIAETALRLHRILMERKNG